MTMVTEVISTKQRNTRVIIGSPREPSGVAWILNCLLELNVMCYVVSKERMWRSIENGYELQDSAHKFIKWLPLLNVKKQFQFSPGTEVLWAHDFADTTKFDLPLFFIRDPRDSLYSRYKRDASTVDYLTYIQEIESDTQLSRLHTWCLFTLHWLSRPSVQIARFEDYKVNADITLRKILNFLSLSYADQQLAQAVVNSSFEKAKDVELARKAVDADKRLVNRSGSVGEWKTFSNSIERDATALITETAKPLLKYLGYEMTAVASEGPSHIELKKGFSPQTLNKLAQVLGGNQVSSDVLKTLLQVLENA